MGDNGKALEAMGGHWELMGDNGRHWEVLGGIERQ